MESGVVVQIPPGFDFIESDNRSLHFNKIRKDFFHNSTLHSPHSTLIGYPFVFSHSLRPTFAPGFSTRYVTATARASAAAKQMRV